MRKTLIRLKFTKYLPKNVMHQGGESLLGGTGVRETCSHTERIRQPTLSRREDH